MDMQDAPDSAALMARLALQSIDLVGEEAGEAVRSHWLVLRDMAALVQPIGCSTDDR